MSRFLLFLLLLVVGLGLIFLPMSIESGGIQWPSLARPAAQLPQPWEGGASVRVSPQGGIIAAGADLPGKCPATVVLDGGDTLGKLAQNCGISLASLLAANPQIANPNQVFTGQAINIPQLAGRGGGSDLDEGFVLHNSSFLPGTVVDVYVEQMPPGAQVSIGIGLSATGYRILNNGVVEQDGTLSTPLVIPEDAVPGDRAFVLISSDGIPSVQVISAEFVIGR